jgi:uncharacterized protein YbjT (DUF2867 family)
LSRGKKVSVRSVTVFGGTGFLGRRIVGHLLAHGFSVRTASRHPGPDWKLFGRDDLHRQSVEADIHNERSVAHAIAGAYGVVNAVSLYVERGNEAVRHPIALAPTARSQTGSNGST